MSFPTFSRSPLTSRWFWLFALALAAFIAWQFAREPADDGGPARSPVAAGAGNATTGKPALTVTLVTPQVGEWPRTLAASGNVAAWQEAVISAEISNLLLTDVRVNVGDEVKKGQVLALISRDTVAAALAESSAAVAEAEAVLAEARANAERANRLQAAGFISGQQTVQYLTAEKAALARLDAARARLRADQLRLAQTTVRAPDAGVISARSATVGTMAQPGQELFRLIRGGRLEWRAEVAEADLDALRPGMAATLTAPNGARVEGRVRMVAPTVDPQTLNALVYVDLPAAGAGSALRAGTFARGEFDFGRAAAMSLPQSAVLVRDGFAYVFRLEAGDRVAQTKVAVGQRLGDRIEILGGIDARTRVVESGAGFLADGDLVRVVGAPAAAGAPR
jgi:RND family efflux transporter MFP subunit